MTSAGADLALRSGREPRELALRTSDDLELSARMWEPAGEARGTVVLVHGFAGSQHDPPVLATARALSAAGYAVLTYDARGHGRSPGRCTLGDLERHDVAAAVEHVADGPSPTILVGASMGAIAVLRYGAESEAVDGIVTVSGPSSWRVPRNPRTIAATALTQTRIGRSLARRHLSVEIDPVWSDAAPPLELVAGIAQPVAVVHGRRDRFIPLRDAHELYRAASEPSRLFVVDGMTHGYVHGGIDAIRDAVDWVRAQAA